MGRMRTLSSATSRGVRHDTQIHRCGLPRLRRVNRRQYIREAEGKHAGREDAPGVVGLMSLPEGPEMMQANERFLSRRLA